MARVLVTGGTGTLGTQLVARLVARGHDVATMSRRAQVTGPVTAVTHRRGDVRSGEGLGAAMAGVDTVVHAATARRHVRAVEVEGTANVVAAARESGAHVIYVSIVGVDAMRFPYYRAKWAAEQVVESGGALWSIQRATQFHELLDMFLGWRAFPSTARMSFQPVDIADVSDRLADLVESGPTGRAEDFGGPAVVPLRELDDIRRRIRGRGARLVPVPAVGFLKDFDQGLHLCPDHAGGRRTWEEWLTAGPAGP